MTAKWFMYVLPEEAAKFGLESDGPCYAPVLAGEPKCSWADWERDGSTANQVGQAGRDDEDEEWGATWMDAVVYFCQFATGTMGASEFYLWDDAEKGWWKYQYADWSTSEGMSAPEWSAVEGPRGELWRPEDLT